MILTSHHRNYSLALRKLALLRRTYEDHTVELLSKRNASGHYSAHGYTYVWEVGEKKEPRAEYVVHFDYASKRDKHTKLRFQFHVFGPGEVSDEKIVEAIREGASTGHYPKGWRERVIYWGRVPIDDARTQVKRKTTPNELELSQQTVLGGSSNVIARTNRRSKKGKAKR